MIINKKSSLILILKVLEEYTDEDHLLTQQQIIDKISQLYNIDLERKSVSNSISLLIELGYDIISSPRKGYRRTIFLSAGGFFKERGKPIS